MTDTVDAPGTVLQVLGEKADAAEAELAEKAGTNGHATAAESEDFDAFWAEQDRQGQVLRNVFGVDVELPPALPLRFEIEARRTVSSQSEQDTKRMVALLFGDEAFQRWQNTGMDIDQFGTLLLWGTANVRKPRSMSLSEAYATYQRMLAEREAGEAEGKAPASGPRSSNTGAGSRRTSAASTSSRRKRSRR